MKCAMELMMISAVNSVERRKEEEERKRKELQEICENTIAYCNELGNTIETLADEGRQPKVIFYITNDDHILTSTYRDYADHRLSYRGGKKIDLDIMAEWFAKFCFRVEKEEFWYYRYGCGQNKGYKVIISPSPECF